jgi:CRISPR system Cascade subunit CasA
MTPNYNLLSNAPIRATVSSGSTFCFSLPRLLAVLMRDEIAAFPALRPHQRHAWHAFLVQLGALALLSGGRPEAPETEEEWLQLLRTLTPDHLDDAPWRLVSELNRPALLQAPVPRGNENQLEHSADFQTRSTSWSQRQTTSSSKRSWPAQLRTTGYSPS